MIHMQPSESRPSSSFPASSITHSGVCNPSFRSVVTRSFAAAMSTRSVGACKVRLPLPPFPLAI